MPEVEVCFSPNVYPLFHKDDAIVVVIDVLRATSAITTAFYNGVAQMIPVATVEEALEYKKKGFIVAAERNGEVVPGFDLGNSPFGYMSKKVAGKTIAITTTNGTQAIKAAEKAKRILIGSFLNLDVMIDYLRAEKKDVLLLCAGWKNKFNLEDTLYAGAIADALISKYEFTTSCDSAIAAGQLYHLAKHDLYEFLSRSSHRNRLSKLNLDRDIKYCLTPNQCPVIPVMEKGSLTKLQLA
ncbi:MAG: 2-phosphosulfolactate phosphatase [Bacteroidia bacterium]|jgi:2-phosphosulfolactate phosphatase|nr:2-phosphosulfolactate phosphatase [Sphingobacteriaceae bacterium]MBK7312168.1 2-phosphosulfolactate phosphatase [Sphingobacteriaceae bacterium]MBP9068859.1 2-phosphosulfolactate phosphatase [Bacteroidia bacterium]